MMNKIDFALDIEVLIDQVEEAIYLEKWENDFSKETAERNEKIKQLQKIKQTLRRAYLQTAALD